MLISFIFPIEDFVKPIEVIDMAVYKFGVSCPNCGEYEVSEDDFMAYLADNKNLINKIRTKLARQTILGARIKFKDGGCRECREVIETPGKVTMIKYRHSSLN